MITLKQVYNTRNPSYKVTENTIPFDVFDTDSPPAINTILTDDTLFSFASVGGMVHDTIDNFDDDEDFLVELHIYYAYIQSDPGEPTRWKDALSGPEQDWWLKSTTAEFNNFLSRKAWAFIPR